LASKSFVTTALSSGEFMNQLLTQEKFAVILETKDKLITYQWKLLATSRDSSVQRCDFRKSPAVAVDLD